VDLFLDICQGIGLACAVGMRPFLPGILAGALAAANAGVDFEGTPFSFLESPVFLVVLALALALFTFGERRGGLGRLESTRLGPTIGALGPALGGLLFAGTLDDRHQVWWYGLVLGVICGLIAAAAVSQLLRRVRARLDPEAAGALPVYAEAAGVAVAALSVLAPPFGLVALVFLIALLVTGRRRSSEKYAGLRILR